jgi:hypothetical protein
MALNVFSNKTTIRKTDLSFVLENTNCPVYLELWKDEVISHVWVVRETKDWALMQEEIYPEPTGILVSPASSSYPHSSIQSYSKQDTVSDVHLARNELWQGEVSV